MREARFLTRGVGPTRCGATPALSQPADETRTPGGGGVYKGDEESSPPEEKDSWRERASERVGVSV